MDFRNARTQKLIVVALGTAAIFYLYFFSTFIPFGHRAMAAQRADLESQYQQLSSDLSKARQTLNNLAGVEKQYAVLNRRWEVASKLLPEDKEVAELLRKVTLVGQQSGVEFLLFKPKPQVNGEVYNENPVDVQVTGGYHQVGQFLASVANMDRIVNVSDLALTSPDKNKKGSDDQDSDQTVEAHFTATAYTLNPNAPAPAPAGVAGDKSAGRGTPAPAAAKGKGAKRNEG